MESWMKKTSSRTYCHSRPSILLKRGSSQYYVRQRRPRCENRAENDGVCPKKASIAFSTAKIDAARGARHSIGSRVASHNVETPFAARRSWQVGPRAPAQRRNAPFESLAPRRLRGAARAGLAPMVFEHDSFRSGRRGNQISGAPRHRRNLTNWLISTQAAVAKESSTSCNAASASRSRTPSATTIARPRSRRSARASRSSSGACRS